MRNDSKMRPTFVLALAAVLAAQAPPSRAAQHEHHQQTSPPPAQTNAPSAPAGTRAPAGQADPHAGHQMPGMGAEEGVQGITPMPMPPVEALPAGAAVRLADLEQRVRENSPLVQQARAAVDAARGRARQAGLYPNPVIGYSADEVSFQDEVRGGQQGFFVDQTIVLGGKLGKRRDVLLQAVREAEARLEAAQFSATTGVRMAYFELLAADRRFELERRLVELVDEAVRTSYGLYNAGQSDKPDVLAIEIEDQQARVGATEARSAWERARQQLAIAVGDPALEIGRAEGTLEDAIPNAGETTLAVLLERSPDIVAARARVETAESAVRAAKAERTPDLFLRGGMHYNRELLEARNQAVGWQGMFEAGVSVPLFNRNQGGIAAAEADVLAANAELRSTELAVRSRYTSVYTAYRDAQRTADIYRTQIIPRAEQSYALYLDKYRQMTAAYPQVLIARRTWLQVNVDYIASLERLYRAALPIQGLLVSGSVGEQGVFSGPLALPGEGRTGPAAGSPISQ
jgi:cobalt-zinc-cadmium efflux system outer membrane protein